MPGLVWALPVALGILGCDHRVIVGADSDGLDESAPSGIPGSEATADSADSASPDSTVPASPFQGEWIVGIGTASEAAPLFLLLQIDETDDGLHGTLTPLDPHAGLPQSRVAVGESYSAYGDGWEEVFEFRFDDVIIPAVAFDDETDDMELSKLEISAILSAPHRGSGYPSAEEEPASQHGPYFDGHIEVIETSSLDDWAAFMARI